MTRKPFNVAVEEGKENTVVINQWVSNGNGQCDVRRIVLCAEQTPVFIERLKSVSMDIASRNVTPAEKAANGIAWVGNGRFN